MAYQIFIFLINIMYFILLYFTVFGYLKDIDIEGIIYTNLEKRI